MSPILPSGPCDTNRITTCSAQLVTHTHTHTHSLSHAEANSCSDTLPLTSFFTSYGTVVPLEFWFCITAVELSATRSCGPRMQVPCAGVNAGMQVLCAYLFEGLVLEYLRTL